MLKLIKQKNTDDTIDAVIKTNEGAFIVTKDINEELYLGHFDKAQAGNIVTLSYTVVAWFEGTDDNVVNNLDTIYDTMVSYLSFEAINIPN